MTTTNDSISIPRQLPPAPPAGTPWATMAQAERRAAAMRAADAGRGSALLSLDHGTTPAAVRVYLRAARLALGLPTLGRVAATRPPPGPPPGPGVLLDDATDSVCRWPLWGDDEHPVVGTHLICGEAKQPGTRSPYCPVCADRATWTPHARRTVGLYIDPRGRAR